MPDGSRLPTTRVVSARVNLRQRFRDIWSYRELLLGLVRKELKVKYKNSILGFLWSMLNPATTLLVYYVVFQIILKSGIPYFAIFLICGVLGAGIGYLYRFKVQLRRMMTVIAAVAVFVVVEVTSGTLSSKYSVRIPSRIRSRSSASSTGNMISTRRLRLRGIRSALPR